MSAPEQVDLTAEQPWRAIPMPGSEQHLDLVRLASPRDRFTIHARFPAGFERPVAGGYAVSEEFLVLEGSLEVDGVTFGVGDLVLVPAWYLRDGMRSPSGARVLAWFGGPAEFLPADDLQVCVEQMTVVDPGAAEVGPLMTSDIALWSSGSAPEGDGTTELVSADRTSWTRGDVTPSTGDLVRRDR